MWSHPRRLRADAPGPDAPHSAGSRVPVGTESSAAGQDGARSRGSTRATTRDADQFSRTIVNEPGRAAGRTTHPEFRVALQPSPCRVVPSSGPVTGTDSVDPSAARKAPL